jgi:predicted transcriptional regulator
MRKDDEIMAYLMVNDVTQREVAKHFKVSQSKVSNCRRKAVDDGYITDEGGVTDAGRQFLKDLGIEPPDSDPEFDLAA